MLTSFHYEVLCLSTQFCGLPFARANSPERDGSTFCQHSTSQLPKDSSGASGIGMQVPIPCVRTVLLHTTVCNFSYSRDSSVPSQGNKPPEFCRRRGGVVAWLMEQRVRARLEICRAHRGPSWLQLNIGVHRATAGHARTRLLRERQAEMTTRQEGNTKHSLQSLQQPVCIS